MDVNLLPVRIIVLISTINKGVCGQCFKRKSQGKHEYTFTRSPPVSNIPQLASFFADYAQVPEEGRGDVLDAVRHLLELALKLMTTGSLDEEVDSEYVQGLDWYNSSIAVLAVESSAG